MKYMKTFFIVLCAVFFYGKSMAQDVQRKVCQGTDLTKWTDCYWKGSYSNGDKYEGEFKDGAFNGLGSYYFFSNGDKYVGEFKGGKRHGQGIYIRLDGSMLLGDWVEGKADGNLIEYGANRQVKRSGIYKDGKLVTSQYIDPNSFTRTEAARAAEDKRWQEAKDADEKRIQEAKADEERVIWLTTPEGKKFTANEEAKAKKLEAERLRLSAQDAAIAKKQEAERLRLFAIEEAKVKKQEAEQAARDRVAAAQTEKANKAFQKQGQTDYETLGTCLAFLNYKSKNSIRWNLRETSFFNKYNKLQTPQMMEAIRKSEISCKRFTGTLDFDKCMIPNLTKNQYDFWSGVVMTQYQLKLAKSEMDIAQVEAICVPIFEGSK